MDLKIEELVMKANSKRRYQFLLITVGFFIYVTTNIISATYGLFTIEPLVNYTSKDGTFHSDVSLDNEICQDDPNFVITKNYTSTWYYSFGDYCNRDVNFLNPLIGNFGSLVGFLTVPFQIMFWGERNAILITGYGYSVVCFVNIFMPSWATAFIFDFLNNLTGTSMEILFFMSLSENCPGKIRSIALNIIGSGYSIAGLIFAGLFDYLNDWKIPFIISAASNLVLTICIHIFVYESPRYYLKIGKIDLFVQTLKKIAKFNSVSAEFDPIANRILNEYDEEQANERSGMRIDEVNKSLLEKFKEFIGKQEETAKKYTIIDVFRFKSSRYIFIIMSFIGIVNSGIYQSLQVSLNSTGVNVFTISMITYAIQMVFAVLAGFTMNIRFLKRKGNLYISLVISVALMITVMFVKVSKIFSAVLLMIIVISSYFFTSVIGAYSTEVYSTKILNTAITWSSAIGIGGTMTFTTFVTLLKPFYYYLIFACLYVVVAIVLIFLPETYGKPQPTEIIEEKLIEENENMN